MPETPRGFHEIVAKQLEKGPEDPDGYTAVYLCLSLGGHSYTKTGKLSELPKMSTCPTHNQPATCLQLVINENPDGLRRTITALLQSELSALEEAEALL